MEKEPQPGPNAKCAPNAFIERGSAAEHLKLLSSCPPLSPLPGGKAKQTQAGMQAGRQARRQAGGRWCPPPPCLSQFQIQRKKILK